MRGRPLSRSLLILMGPNDPSGTELKHVSLSFPELPYEQAFVIGQVWLCERIQRLGQSAHALGEDL